MKTIKKLLTCSGSFTSPGSPPDHDDVDRAGESNQGPARPGEHRLSGLTDRPIPPRPQAAPAYAFSSSERQVRTRIKTQLLPRINDLLELCRTLDVESIPTDQAEALQSLMQQRVQGTLVHAGQPIGGGDDLEEAVKRLEDHVEDYFRRNPDIARPILQPQLPAVATSDHVNTSYSSRRPLLSPYMLRPNPVTREGRRAEISNEVMRAALKMVHVPSQTSSAMEQAENVVDTKVGNFLEAIRQNKQVDMMVVATAKEHKDNASDLVDALRNLVKSQPRLGRSWD
ncbi:hypothetical protein XBLMG947_1371 [Xanthomonas bromi]|uniref:Uncharacterized protein n=2 Tax=Xanthomonas bromi TaxID=56449 RepID=A0A1C3NJQ4_9XANT|nr:hypothetical protein XBLMG947_1371 [Xanthomonas bromi]